MYFLHIFSAGLLLIFSLFFFLHHCSIRTNIAVTYAFNIHWKCLCSFRGETQTLELIWFSILKIKMQATWKLYQSMSWWDVISKKDSILVAHSKLFIGAGDDYLFYVHILDVWKSQDIFSCSRKGILLLGPPSSKFYSSKQWGKNLAFLDSFAIIIFDTYYF